jgi:Tol biopolymer transport system component
MATGQKAFEGRTHASLIASIIGHEPAPVSAIQPAVPPALDRVIRIALAKDPDNRWQSTRDIVRELKETTPLSTATRIMSQPAVAASSTRSRRREAAAWGLAALAAVAATTLSLLLIRGRTGDGDPVTRFTVTSPPKTDFSSNSLLAVSPNGRWIVFAAAAGNAPPQLWLRSMDATDAVLLTGTDGAGVPFWSHDSRYIGFFADGKLKKLPVGGGPAIVLCDAPVMGNSRGGAAWSRDDVIVFQPKNDGPLFRVPAAGGVPTQATVLDESRKEIAHRYPTFLPDAKHFLYVAMPGGSIVLGALDSRDTKVLLQADSKPVFGAPGYLLFVRQTVLMAQPFNMARLELEGEAVPVGQQVRVNPGFGSAAFSASDNGVLAYGTGQTVQTSRLEWFDREGRPTPALDGLFDYRALSLSPDGTRAVAHRHEEPVGGGLWLTDLGRAATSRFTLTAAHDSFPVWSPDAARVAFSSDREGQRDAIYVKAANGAGGEQQVLKAPNAVRPADWSFDGRAIVYEQIDPKNSVDVFLVPLSGDRQPQPVAATSFVEAAPQFSPDGRYVAYTSNEARRFEIYLQSVVPGGGKWQVSTSGGFFSRWRRDGTELYYLSLDSSMMAVPIDLRGSAPVIGVPQRLFPTRAAVTNQGFPFAVAADGKRFLVAQQPEQLNATVTVVLNWTAGLLR